MFANQTTFSSISLQEEAAQPNWPRKTRELRTPTLDSTHWNGFSYRPGDIVVAAWGKSGSTLTQQILYQLIFDGASGLATDTARGVSPWLDMRFLPVEETLNALAEQRHRRFIKTHLPLDALPFSPDAQYIYVGRDPRDMIWSQYNHHLGSTDFVLTALGKLRASSDHEVYPVDRCERDYFLYWLENDSLPGFPMPSLWDNVNSWWSAVGISRILFMHFNNIVSDLDSSATRIAEFIGIETTGTLLTKLRAHCQLDYMRDRAAENPRMARAFRSGAKTFFNAGTNGRWRGVLTPADIARFEAVAEERLGSDCARWMLTGELQHG